MKYRFKTTIVILLAMAVTLTSAQKISGGFKAGINLASFHGDDVEDAKRKIGFCGGVFATFGLGKTFVIQPELLYSQKGAKQEEVFMNETIKVTYKFNYLELPLFLKVIIPIQGKVTPNFLLGPYFGFTITDPRGEVEINGMKMEDDLEDVKDTDFGVVFGGGVNFGLGRGNIVFDIRYSIGLTTLAEEDGDVKNNAFSFLLGYSF